MSMQTVFGFGFSDQIEDTAAGHVLYSRELLYFGEHVHFLLLAVGFDYSQMHSCLRAQSVVEVLNLPEVFTRDSSPIQGINLISLRETLSCSITAGFDGRDIALVATHLHLPAVFRLAVQAGRQKERV